MRRRQRSCVRRIKPAPNNRSNNQTDDQQHQQHVSEPSKRTSDREAIFIPSDTCPCRSFASRPAQCARRSLQSLEGPRHTQIFIPQRGCPVAMEKENHPRDCACCVNRRDTSALVAGRPLRLPRRRPDNIGSTYKTSSSRLRLPAVIWFSQIGHPLAGPTVRQTEAHQRPQEHHPRNSSSCPRPIRPAFCLCKFAVLT